MKDDATDFIIALRMELLRQIALSAGNITKRLRQCRQRAQNLREDQPECAAHNEYGEEDHTDLNILGGFDLCLAGGIVGSDQLVDLRHKGRNLFRNLCLCRAAHFLVRSLGNGTHIAAVRFPQRLHDAKLPLHRLIRGGSQSHRRIALLQSFQNTIVVLQILLHRSAQCLCIPFICRHEPCRPP